jgi:hypothetical protein
VVGFVASRVQPRAERVVASRCGWQIDVAAQPITPQDDNRHRLAHEKLSAAGAVGSRVQVVGSMGGGQRVWSYG